jgi:hypothetical protein
LIPPTIINPVQLSKVMEALNSTSRIPNYVALQQIFAMQHELWSKILPESDAKAGCDLNKHLR